MKTRVVDTSSIIELKQYPHVPRSRILAELDNLVEGDLLFFPPQVIGELKRYSDQKTGGKPDVCLEWASKNETRATRYGLLLDEGKIVLNRVPDLIDYDKIPVGEVDDADPYVVALAVLLKSEGREVAIVTDDRTSKVKKTSLSSAAGIFHIPAVGIRALVIYEENWWDGVEGA